MPSLLRPAKPWRLGLAGLLLASWLAAFAQSPADGAASDDGRAALESEIRLWLARHQGVDAQQIAVVPLDARLRIAPCTSAWELSLPFSNAQSVRARCGAEVPPRQYIVRTEIKPVQQEVVLSRDLAPGHVLRPEDLRLASVQPGHSAAYLNVQPLLGRHLSRAASANSRVLPDLLSDQVQISRLVRALRVGQTVQRSDVKTEWLKAEHAPDHFWSAPWPQTAIIARSLPVGHILRSDDWADLVEAVVARVDLPRGVTLTPAMLMLQTLPASAQSAQYLSTLAQVAASETVRPIASGSPISRLDVRSAALVKRGNTVQISVGKGRGFAISTQVEALQDGRLGEQIRLLNRQSGRTIRAVVTGANAAEAL